MNSIPEPVARPSWSWNPRRSLPLIALHLVIVAILTALTQLGGLAWIIALATRQKALVFLASHAALTISAIWIAPAFGREALSCSADGPLQVRSWIFCAANRNYVAPELKASLNELARAVERRFPGTTTQVLDANFPFFDGFPLLPHLSHDDGRKVDLAFYYQRGGRYLEGATRSPIGYFAFEQGPTDCPFNWITWRWDLDFIQPVWRELKLEPRRTDFAVETAVSDARIGKLFIEPHLQRSLNLADPKIRFQGCRAARHDDHFHVQLKDS